MLERQPDDEGRPHADFTGETECTAVPVDDHAVGNGKPLTDSGTDVASREERVEHSIGDLGSDSTTRVADTDFGMGADDRCGNSNPAPV